jgi:hypothetical protein
MHDRSAFLTLTYADKMLPADRSISVKHWQLFAKRLRKEVGPFRFYHVGEYGEKKGRPHYHAMIFGPDLLKKADQVGSGKRGDPLFRNSMVEDLWRN